MNTFPFTTAFDVTIPALAPFVANIIINPTATSHLRLKSIQFTCTFAGSSLITVQVGTSLAVLGDILFQGIFANTPRESVGKDWGESGLDSNRNGFGLYITGDANDRLVGTVQYQIIEGEPVA